MLRVCQRAAHAVDGGRFANAQKRVLASRCTHGHRQAPRLLLGEKAARAGSVRRCTTPPVFVSHAQGHGNKPRQRARAWSVPRCRRAWIGMQKTCVEGAPRPLEEHPATYVTLSTKKSAGDFPSQGTTERTRQPRPGGEWKFGELMLALASTRMNTAGRPDEGGRTAKNVLSCGVQRGELFSVLLGPSAHLIRKTAPCSSWLPPYPPLVLLHALCACSTVRKAGGVGGMCARGEESGEGTSDWGCASGKVFFRRGRQGCKHFEQNPCLGVVAMPQQNTPPKRKGSCDDGYPRQNAKRSLAHFATSVHVPHCPPRLGSQTWRKESWL